MLGPALSVILSVEWASSNKAPTSNVRLICVVSWSLRHLDPASCSGRSSLRAVSGVLCPKGKANALTGQLVCGDCSAGTFSDTAGSDTCTFSFVVASVKEFTGVHSALVRK